MLRRRAEPHETVRVEIDGTDVTVAVGDSVAAALLLAGPEPYRLSTVGQVPRAPFCLIGNCFDCLVEIDGVPNRQGCLVPVADGMKIRRQQGKPKVGP